MSKEIKKKEYCVLKMSGVKIWISEKRAENLQEVLHNLKGSKFIRIKLPDGGQITVNSSRIEGIYPEEYIRNLEREKSGQWKCKWGTWHNKFEECACGELKKFNKK